MYKRILIVVDHRPVSQAAAREGTALAKAHNADVVFFSVLPRYAVPVADTPPFPMVAPHEFQRAAKDSAQKWLAAATAIADKVGVTSRTGTGSGEDDSHCIVDAARRRRCDLIVVATEGRNALLRLLTGSVIPGLITASPVPVLVCKDRPRLARARENVVPIKARKTATRANAAASIR
jgi:nucleotide-binding universal stress UspA family protein